jgi:hypothetical protein
MQSLQNFLTLTMAPNKLTLRNAFNEVYGQTHVYVRSTVMKYRKWLFDGIGPDRLEKYVAGHPNHTVLDGIASFQAEWRELDNRSVSKKPETDEHPEDEEQ